METKTSKKELKKISRDFRLISSRLMKSHYDDFNNDLASFVQYIKQTDFIYDYIKSNIKQKYDIQKEFTKMQTNFGPRIFTKPGSIEDEISYTYQLLEYIVENKINYLKYTIGYSNSRKFQDMINGFCERVILNFIDDINAYILDTFENEGYTETNETAGLVVNGDYSQINISKDYSKIDAIQNNSINMEQLNNLIDKVKQSIPEEINDDDKEIIIDTIEGLKEEIEKPKIKKGRIKSFLTTIDNSISKFSNYAQLAAALIEIVNFFSNINY